MASNDTQQLREKMEESRFALLGVAASLRRLEEDLEQPVPDVDVEPRDELAFLRLVTNDAAAILRLLTGVVDREAETMEKAEAALVALTRGGRTQEVA